MNEYKNLKIKRIKTWLFDIYYCDLKSLKELIKILKTVV